MLKSILCAYSYIPLKGAITATGAGADAGVQGEYKVNKQLTFKSCAPFNNCIAQINNTQINNVMYNLIEYSSSYSKISGNVWSSQR